MISLTKVCTTCGIEQGVGKYHKEKRGKYGVKAVCKNCFNQYCAQYYEINKETRVEQKKTYYENNKESIAERHSIYQKTNPHIVNAITAKRKAAKLQATPAWVDLEVIKGMYQLATIFRRTGIDMHVDHIVPLQSDLVSGLHCEANLQLMSASDNMSKGNRYWPDMSA